MCIAAVLAPIGLPSRRTYTARVADESDKAKPVSMRKRPPESAAPGSRRPATVTAAAVAIAVSGATALIAALSLFNERPWLTHETVKANKSAVATAVSSAVADATKTSAAPAVVHHASATASASATKKYPISGSSLHDYVTRQQTGGLTMTLFLCLALAFIGFGVYRGRHWSRWGTVALWVLASFTGTFASAVRLITIGSSAPGTFKVFVFVSAATLLLAVFFVNMRQSTSYFALSRPVVGEGAPQRRGLFAPRTPPARRSTAAPNSAKTNATATSGATPSGTSTESQRQRAKKRASANAEAAARGAELARTRAKAAGKSRRTDT